MLSLQLAFDETEPCSLQSSAPNSEHGDGQMFPSKPKVSACMLRVVVVKRTRISLAKLLTMVLVFAISGPTINPEELKVGAVTFGS